MPPSRWEDLAPLENSNGRLVCRTHGLVICGICCTDYSFMDDSLSDGEDDEGEEKKEEEEEEDGDDDFHLGSRPAQSVLIPDSISGQEMRRGTSNVLATRFRPPSDSLKPMELFRGRRDFGMLTSDPRSGLILTDGACLNNGQPNPRAGWAFVHGLRGGKPAVASGRLEGKGPFGEDGIQSSNRAELRAVLAALRFRHWPGEGFTTMTIATDSEYVVEGCTSWARSWVRRGWKTAGNADVKNRDLWELLLGEVETAKENGLSVQFWRIPREWNAVADAAAKKAAEEYDAPDQWCEVMGLPF